MKIFSGFSLVIIFFVLFSLESFSVEKKDIQILNENLPSFMGASNAGKEFYLTFHPCWNDAASPNSSLRIYVSSMYKTTVKLEIPGLGITRTKEINPNEVIEFPLLVSEGLLYDKGNGADPIPPKPEGVGIKRAIKITSDDPIVCYGMVRFQYTSDGYLAIPVNNWGKHYQVASYADPNTSGTQFLPSYTSIIAAYDNTEVTFKLGGSITAGALLQNNDTLRIGESIKRVLNAGDVWLIPGIGLLNDLTGSQITADKNIGVYSGNFCAYVPTHIAACDYIIEQEIPSDFWGKNYYVPTIYNRKKASIVKIFAKEPNTSISFNNVPLYNITALDGKEGTGYIETRASTDSIPTPVLINSDKEINVVLFNPGQQDDNVSSDPFQMNIVSDAQFQKDITFNTPGIRGGLGFRDNYISIIYKATPEGKIPDDISFAEVNNGQFNWIKMNDYSSNPGTPFPYDLPDQNGRKHFCKTIRLPYDGVYKIKANEPFAALGYGFGDYDSYGYPLSGAMIDQTNGDILVPEVKMVDLGNGNYKGLINELGNPDGRVSKNHDKLQTESVSSGFSFIDMINSYSYNYKFIKDEFMPGETKSVSFSLTKIVDYLDSKAVIYVSDRRGNDTTIIIEDNVALRSMPPIITADNTDFGYLKNGEKKQLTFKLTNKGKVNSKPVEDIILENNNSGYKILLPPNFPLTLKANEAIDLIIEFTAGANEGEFLNKIGVKTADTTINRIAIKATVSSPTIYTTDINFSSHIIGQPNDEAYAEIKNTGFTTLEINNIDFPKNNAFSFLKYQPSVEYPISIGPNKTVHFYVEFNPKVAGEFKDSLVFYSDGKIIKNVSYLTGKAIVNSVAEFENKYGVINLSVKDNKISFSSGNDITLNSYSIFDLTGKIIQTGSPAALLNNYNITISNISGSVYFIELNTQYGKVVKKIVVE